MLAPHITALHGRAFSPDITSISPLSYPFPPLVFVETESTVRTERLVFFRLVSSAVSIDLVRNEETGEVSAPTHQWVSDTAAAGTS